VFQAFVVSCVVLAILSSVFMRRPKKADRGHPSVPGRSLLLPYCDIDVLMCGQGWLPLESRQFLQCGVRRDGF
jgi:hypothetical protein